MAVYKPQSKYTEILNNKPQIPGWGSSPSEQDGPDELIRRIIDLEIEIKELKHELMKLINTK